MCNIESIGFDDDNGGERNKKEEAEKLFEKFHSVVTRYVHKEVDDFDDLGCLGALAGVAEFPAQIECASLA